MADRAGVSVASLMRSALLDISPPRATRRPTINHIVAARLFGELATLADAYIQAADAAPDQGKYDALLSAASRDLAEMRHVWFQAMGREP